MERQKGLATLIIVLLVTLAIGGYVIYQKQFKPIPVPIAVPTPLATDSAETVNWKTYTNFGISLKYNSFYSPVEKFHSLESGEPIFIVTDKFNFDKNKISLCVTYGEKLCLIPGKNKNQEQDMQTIKLAGKDAISFFVSTAKQDGGNVIHVVQTLDSNPIEIALTVDGMGGEEAFQQILSTVKFLDQKEAINATNWKTYNGKNYTFKYPETWVIKEQITDEDKGLTFYIFSPDYNPDPNFENPHEGGNIVGAKSGSRLEVTSEVSPAFKSYEDYKKHWEINSVGWHGYSFEKKEEIAFNGMKIMVSTGGKPDGLGRLSASYFYKDGRIYDVVLISSNNQDMVFNQILSTFRFD